MKAHPIKRGFSLVELSIVLVILGLLTGGILTGQNLIRAAELRAVTTEYKAFQTAVMTFKDKYFYLPGDIPNASDFWGATAAGNSCTTTQGTGTQTCSGNADGYINTPSYSNERFRFWQHLANAGLIEGSYTGIEGSSGNSNHAVGGTNAPFSKVSQGVWHSTTPCAGCNVSGNPSIPDGNHGNILFLGGQTGSNAPSVKIFSTEEAWNIDTKVDDGHAARGKLIASWNDCTESDASGDELSYDLGATGKLCYLLFRKAY